MANCSLKPSVMDSNIHVLRHSIKGELDRKELIFIDFAPYEGKSDRRAFSNKTASI